MADEKRTSQAAAPAASAGKKETLTESLRRFEDAHLNYFREVRDAWVETQQRYQQACSQTYSQESYLPEDVQKRFEEAYRNHLRAIKDAWAKLDVDSIDLGSGS